MRASFCPCVCLGTHHTGVFILGEIWDSFFLSLLCEFYSNEKTTLHLGQGFYTHKIRILLLTQEGKLGGTQDRCRNPVTFSLHVDLCSIFFLQIPKSDFEINECIHL